MAVPSFLSTPLSMYEIAEQYWDLNFIPSRYVFSVLSSVSNDQLEKEKCEEFCKPEGQEDLLNYTRRPRRTIIEVLKDFHKSTSQLTIDTLFELFSPIKPRSFSIASGYRQMSGTSVDLLVAVVKYYSKLKCARLGLCSNWLASLNVDDSIYGWIKKGTFQFPQDKNTPCILIGPGTGFAPFRSYIQDRIADGTASKDVLVMFFGCRYKEKDFHCRQELTKWSDDGHLNLICAFSRDQESKVYVQHKIAEQKELMYDLLVNKKAMIFISGNGKNMPDNVKTAFIDDVLCSVGNMDRIKAECLLESMERDLKLQIETW